MKLTLEIDIPGIEEYEQEAEYRMPKEGDHYLAALSDAVECSEIDWQRNGPDKRIILKKKKRPDKLETMMELLKYEPSNTCEQRLYEAVQELTNRIKKLEGLTK